MSIISEEEGSIISTPSLAYPPLSPQLQQQQQQEEKDLQRTCIHFASRLIKLRSELRSPSYMMRSSSFSLGSSQQAQYRSSLYSIAIDKEKNQTKKSSRSPSQEQLKSLPLFLLGRAHSLPNVLHPYLHKLAFREDESEIASSSSSLSTILSDDEATPLTYPTEFVRRQQNKTKNKQQHFDHAKNNHLSLPPLFFSSSCDKNKAKTRSSYFMIPSNYSKTTPRSISLRERIDQVVLGGSIHYRQQPRKLSRNSYSSLTLASQLLLYASQQAQQQQKKKKEEKSSLEEEGDKVVMTKKKEPPPYEENDLVQENQNLIVKSPPNPSKFINSIKKERNTWHNRQKSNNETLRLLPVDPLQPSLSCDTNKSSFSSCSDTATNSTIVNETVSKNALLITISPSSAAAASVARSKRANIKQQQYLTRLSSSSDDTGGSNGPSSRQLLVKRTLSYDVKLQ